MCQSGRIMLSAVAIILATAATGTADPIPVWSYERLFKESDTVAIVTFETTAPQEEHVKVEGAEVKLRLAKSRLVVEHVIQGKLKKGDTLDITHWLAPKDTDLGRFPKPLVFSKYKEFDMGATAFSVSLKYMVFLQKTDKGYELTSGLKWGVESVKEILTPTFDPLK